MERDHTTFLVVNRSGYPDVFMTRSARKILTKEYIPQFLYLPILTVRDHAFS